MRNIFTAENLAILPVGGMLPHKPVFVTVAVHRSFRLQQLYQSIRNLEASLANKRRAIGAQHNCRFVSRILGYRQSRATQLLAKLGTTVERRSVRELQSLLFKLKRQYRTLHKNYSSPRSTDSRLMCTEALNISTSRTAPPFLYDYRCEVLVPVLQPTGRSDAWITIIGRIVRALSFFA